MDEGAKVYRLHNPDGERYIVDKPKDLSQHSTLKDELSRRGNFWDRLHMMEKTVTYDH